MQQRVNLTSLSTLYSQSDRIGRKLCFRMQRIISRKLVRERGIFQRNKESEVSSHDPVGSLK